MVNLEGWNDPKSGLPEKGVEVFWKYEDGEIVRKSVDENWDAEDIDYFLRGGSQREVRGPIVGWRS